MEILSSTNFRTSWSGSLVVVMEIRSSTNFRTSWSAF